MLQDGRACRAVALAAADPAASVYGVPLLLHPWLAGKNKGKPQRFGGKVANLLADRHQLLQCSVKQSRWDFAHILSNFRVRFPSFRR